MQSVPRPREPTKFYYYIKKIENKKYKYDTLILGILCTGHILFTIATNKSSN